MPIHQIVLGVTPEVGSIRDRRFEQIQVKHYCEKATPCGGSSLPAHRYNHCWMVTSCTGAAVVVVDHVTKDGDTLGRFAIGGQAISMGVDVAMATVGEIRDQRVEEVAVEFLLREGPPDAAVGQIPRPCVNPHVGYHLGCRSSDAPQTRQARPTSQPAPSESASPTSHGQRDPS